MNKATNQKRPGLLFPHRVPTRAWSHVSLDFIFDLPKSKDGHDGICTIVDKFSKQTHFVPFTKQDNDGEQAAKLYFNNIYRLHGLPDILISDRDTQFISAFWRELFRLCDCKLNMSTAH